MNKQKLYLMYKDNYTERYLLTFTWFLKTGTLEAELKYKTHKSLFEKLKKTAKISYYSKVLHKFKINSKRNWQVMKGITGK